MGASIAKLAAWPGGAGLGSRPPSRLFARGRKAIRPRGKQARDVWRGSIGGRFCRQAGRLAGRGRFGLAPVGAFVRAGGKRFARGGSERGTFGEAPSVGASIAKLAAWPGGAGLGSRPPSRLFARGRKAIRPRGKRARDVRRGSIGGRFYRQAGRLAGWGRFGLAPVGAFVRAGGKRFARGGSERGTFGEAPSVGASIAKLVAWPGGAGLGSRPPSRLFARGAKSDSPEGEASAGRSARLHRWALFMIRPEDSMSYRRVRGRHAIQSGGKRFPGQARCLAERFAKRWTLVAYASGRDRRGRAA